MFNLEQAIKSWKRSLKRSPAFEEGQIKEMETHLRDHIDHLVAEGLTDEEAFRRAAEKFGTPEELEDEVYKTKTTKINATPPWKQRSLVTGLFPSYIKVVLRNFRMHKMHAALNISGLSIGIACVIAIFLFLQYELSYDSFIRDADQLYRITFEAQIQDNVNHTSRSAPPIAPALKQEFPEIMEAGRLIVNLYGGRDFTSLFSVDNQQYREEHVYFADHSMLELLSVSLEEGDLQSALSNPNSIVISDDLAGKLFGDENPVGSSIMFQDDFELNITGVFSTLPSNSHLTINGLISMNTLDRNFGSQLQNGWFWIPAYSYVRISGQGDVENLERKLPDFYQKYMPEIKEQYHATIHFQPVRDIHLYSNLQAEIKPNSNAMVLYMFGTVAFFILIIACINYMNLSTARYTVRSREVGVRKVLGANREQLIRQFLSESVAIIIVSFSGAVLLLAIFLPYVNKLTSVPLEVGMLLDMKVIAVLAGVLLVVGILAGSYPALYLSQFKPAHILKGRLSPQFSLAAFRKVLVTVQFMLAVILIAVTLVVSQQLDYMKERPLGFDKQNLLALTLYDMVSSSQLNTLKEELAAKAGVRESAFASGIPGEMPGRTTFYREGEGNLEVQLLPYFYVDENYLTMMDLSLKKGRNFRSGDASDNQRGFIINEAAAQQFSWEDPLGKEIKQGQLEDGSYLINGQVIGVVEDFYIRSLHDPLEPVVLMYSDNSASEVETGYLMVKIADNETMNTIAGIEEVWDGFKPGGSFSYQFVDSKFDHQYHGDTRTATLLSTFSVLAMVIACLGLFGLFSFTTEQRTKEIGVRKILGAGVLNIVGMLSKDMLKLVVIASVIATPVAWYLMSEWLADFAYRIEIGAGTFLLAGFIAIFIAFLTVGWHAVKAALMNPVESLRSE